MAGGALSHGNQKQLELGIALAGKPEILLLDEPTAGMSARRDPRLDGAAAADRGRARLTLLFTEHDMDVVFSTAHRIAVLHQGRLIAEGTPAAIRGDPEVRRVYLGRSRRGERACSKSTRSTRTTGCRARCSACRSRCERGECVCLLGRNGVGKTTVMRSIMGLTPPAQGRVLWKGRRHHRLADRPHRARRDRVRARGPPRVRRAHRAREPGRRAPRGRAGRALDGRGGVRPLPEAGGAARPPRRVPVRRRAADAHHRRGP